MKRPAICVFLWVALAGLASGGQAWAKKAGGGKTAPAAASDTAADDKAPAAAGDQTAAPADTGQAAPAGDSGGGEPTEGEPPRLEGEEAEPPKAKAPTTLSWQDIVVVPRKAFLKGGRIEFSPFTGVSVNDNLIQHYAFGADINYYLTDVFWIGLQGQYFIKSTTDREDLIGLQFNRITSLNKYLYGGTFNFGYVPVYGKFAWFNSSILHWELWAALGVGATVSETIPRNPGASPFKNQLLTVAPGIGSRFFMNDWLTVNFQLRDYVFADKFEPNPNNNPDNPTAAKAMGVSSIVQNYMFYIGVGIYLPTKFQYKTPR
jgi:outer membrane beta-barrel protein